MLQKRRFVIVSSVYRLKRKGNKQSITKENGENARKKREGIRRHPSPMWWRKREVAHNKRERRASRFGMILANTSDERPNTKPGWMTR